LENRKFDLNIEEILEDWETYHGIREVIANAIDEQVLTNTQEIEIKKIKNKVWSIRDFGRGLKYEHLTQKEDDEKLNNPLVIGKFGIGLKDALATFDRRNVNVKIITKHGDIKLIKSTKYGFEDITTLHAEIHPPSDTNFIGTEFILSNINDSDIKKAKNLFLKFSDEIIIENTQYGDILNKKDRNANIYVKGVKVAEEEDFLFSYNITDLTKTMYKSLNRERSNVGRSAYSPRVKNILLSSEKVEIAQKLVDDLKEYTTGLMHDELKWIDIQIHAVKTLNSQEKIVFLTSLELMAYGHVLDHIEDMGYKVIIIPENLRKKIRGLKDNAGNILRDLDQFQIEYIESFEFKFVDVDELESDEKRIFDLQKIIFKIIGGRPNKIKDVLISETMKKDFLYSIDVNGIWDGENIIIKRDQLKDIESFSGTLLHEVVHAKSGAQDSTRAFELALTSLIGQITTILLKSYKK
jgi:hypothetical protein